MKQTDMKNIHIIPTDKPSKFVKDNVMYDYYFYLDVKKDVEAFVGSTPAKGSNKQKQNTLNNK